MWRRKLLFNEMIYYEWATNMSPIRIFSISFSVVATPIFSDIGVCQRFRNFITICNEKKLVMGLSQIPYLCYIIINKFTTPTDKPA